MDNLKEEYNITETMTTKNKKNKQKRYKLKPYIYKVLKKYIENSDHISFSKDSMEVMENIVYDLINSIAEEAARLLRYQKKPTLTYNDIACAVKLIFPGEIAKNSLEFSNEQFKLYKQSIVGNKNN